MIEMQRGSSLRGDAAMTEIEEIVVMLERVGFRCGRGSMREARLAGCDFWCPKDELPTALSVEAARMVELVSAVAHAIAFHIVSGNLDAYLAHVGLADSPSARHH
jgi:hypothetical protein